MAKIFTLKFDDPDMMYEISQRFTSSRDEKGFPGSAWISRFTVCGDCATIELDVESGRFRFVPVSGRPDPWPKKDGATEVARPRRALRGGK